MESHTHQKSVRNPRLFGIILNPINQLEKIRAAPIIWNPLVIVTILAVIGLFLMSTGIDFGNQSGLGSSDIPADEMDFIEKVAKGAFIVIGIFTPVFIISISTLIYFFVAKMNNKDVGFKQLFSMNTYVYLISSLSLIVNGLAFMFVGNVEPDVLFTSLNSIINAEGIIGTFLGMIEVFAIWGIILTAIGLQVVGNFSKGLSWGVVIIFFLITTIIPFIMGV